MAYSDIDKPSDYFNTKLYTGTGSVQNITGVGFQPDFLWVKERSSTSNHMLFDVVRGGTLNRLNSNTASAEITDDPAVAFLSDGFSVSTGDNGMNENTQTYAAWNWLANNTSGSSNTDGSITSQVSASTTSGFSIVSYTGNNTNGATVGHGLGVAPKVIIFKRLTSGDWINYHSSLSEDNYLILNKTDASATASGIFSTSSSTFGFPTAYGGVNGAGLPMIAYCFAEKKGFSKFGSYTGNGNANGTFIYTGFKPAFLIVKRTSTAENWWIHDNKRKEYNPRGTPLKANGNDVEISSVNESSYAIDFLSNGFKARTSEGSVNTSGGSYIYIAFAENPFTTSTGIPCTAR